MDSRKLRGKLEDLFGLKRFLSCINVLDKFLAETKL